MTLGTAVTTSGAAASPNMGYHSSPAVTLIMTLFNARLGLWLGNPGGWGARTFFRSYPQATPRPIMREMLGQTTDTAPYVYLSDGGHFENLGLYEMVRRRCQTIVVCDASADATGTNDDLGNAVRKIRIDLGIPVEFEANPDGSRYFAVGRIRYACDDTGDPPDGVLLYLKPALLGTEPSDVLAYRMTAPTFPNESTVDQFFSESQLESYRALGSYIVQTIGDLPSLDTESPAGTFDWFIQRVKRANASQSGAATA